MQSVAYGCGRSAAQLPDAFHEFRLIDRKDLRYVHNARFREIGLALLQKHVAWRLPPIQIRGNQAHNTCSDRASIEDVILDNYARMPLRECRTGWRPEVKPIHLSLPDITHQRSFIVRRTLVLIPFSRRFSVRSTPFP